MLSSLYAKLIGGGIVLLILGGLFFGLRHYKSLAESRGEKLATICQQTRDSSGQPKLKCSEVTKQIQFMGEEIGTLRTSFNKQSAAVAAMGVETERQQAEGAKASKVAEKRAQGAEATSTRLTASSRSSAAQAKPCEPSKALMEAWK